MVLIPIQFRCAGLAGVVIAAGLFGTRGIAQPAPQNATSVNTPGSVQHTSKVPDTKTAHTSKHRTTKATPQPDPAVATRPPDPPPPDWPANAQAKPASVGWNGRQLSVAATNSSLKQVLQQISSATGVKVEGAGGDERIYGSYGPGPAREVLSELLEGSAYNVLMIGDQGEGTPRELVLSSKGGRGAAAAQGQPGAVQQNQNGDDDAQEDIEPQEQPEQPQRILAPPGGPPQGPPQGGEGRTPQQMIQEMQQRQQQMQQQQQQLQPGVPPPKE